MSQQMQRGQPMIILGEDSQHASGQDAQSTNIAAGKTVAEVIHMALGPKGVDKMLVDSGGQAVIANDGVTILKEMDTDHSAVNMIVEVSGAQGDEIEGGTTTAVTNTGELLDQAENPLDSDVRATTIAQGYRQAAERTKEVLEDNAIEVTEDDREALIEIAVTTMTSKSAESAKDLLSELVIDAVLAVKDDNGIDVNNVSIEKVVDDTTDNSELVEGVIVDKERVDEGMPCAVGDANIAVPDNALEARETEVDTEVNVMDPDQLQQFLNQKEKQPKGMVDQLVEVGADAVFVSDGTSNMVQHYLTKEGILAVRCARSSDLKRLTRVTGGCVVSSLGDTEADDLGFISSVGQKDIGGDEHISAEDIEDAKSITLILRDDTEYVVDELKRTIENSPGVIRMTFEGDGVLPGGGASETELSLQLREFTDLVGGREQLTIEAFAEMLDIIPRILAENAGFDPTDPLVDPHSRHGGGKSAVDLDTYMGEVIGMEEEGAVEPFCVKAQAIESATEAAVIILRVNNVTAAGDLSNSQTGSDDDDGGTPDGMGDGVSDMGGMGGMDGAM